MSNTWPPQQEPSPQEERPHRQRADESRFPQYPRGPNSAPRPYGVQGPYGPYRSQPSQPPSYDEADSGYDGYGRPGPSSAGRPGGQPPQQVKPYRQWGGAPAQEPYPPRYPSPYASQYPQAPYPQTPYPEVPRGAPSPYDPPYDPYSVPGSYNPYGLYSPYDSQPARSPRSRNWLGRLVLILVITMVIASGGVWSLIRYGPFATILPTTAPGTAANAGLHVFTDSAVGVQFDVPDGWTTQDAATINGPEVQATSPDFAAAIAVGSGPKGNGNIVGAANAAMTGVADSGTVENTEGPTYVTFGGATWVQESGDLSRAGVRLHVVVFVAIHGTRAYLLTFVATIATFAATDTRYFHAATQSFRFLS